jgi:PhnB protein
MSSSPADATPKMPPAKGGVVAYLTVDGASAAAEFYKKAFGAEEVFRYPVDEKGRTMHIHLYLNGSSVMLSDAYPEHGHPIQAPAGFNLTLMIQDIDARYRRAIDAGAKEIMPPTDMFWGDRYAQLRDPYGVMWSMNQGKA